MQLRSTSKPHKPTNIADMIEKITPETLPDFAESKNISPEESQRNFIRAGEASLAHYEATGLHISHEEYKAWRASSRQAMPDCHI